ncbi:MAG TPA: hypothetical protein VJR29_11915 [bacterium]|nr:hypothetical protein [bacterium]
MTETGIGSFRQRFENGAVDLNRRFGSAGLLQARGEVGQALGEKLRVLFLEQSLELRFLARIQGFGSRFEMSPKDVERSSATAWRDRSAHE